MTYITGAIYPSGDRIRIGAPEEETLSAYQQPNTAVALGYANPDIHELHALQKTFNLHELAIEDAGRGHQRAKLERYGDSLFTVIRPAIYLDKEEEVRLSELHLFTGPRYTLALVRDEQRSNQRINDQFNLLYATPDASPARLLHRILDNTVDGTHPCSTASKTTATKSKTSSSPTASGARPTPSHGASTNCSTRLSTSSVPADPSNP